MLEAVRVDKMGSIVEEVEARTSVNWEDFIGRYDLDRSRMMEAWS